MNNETKKRVLLIGIDQAILDLFERYIDEGIMPNLKELIDGGFISEAFSSPPCDTPTNWTTIATGATTGRHGSTSFYPHKIGEPFEKGLQKRSRSQLAEFCQAEYIWDAADRAGLKSFIINYPAGWPGNLKHGVMSSYTWNVPECPKRIFQKAKKRTYKQGHSNKSRNISLVENEDIRDKCNSKLEPLKIKLTIKNSTEESFAYITGKETYDTLTLLRNRKDENKVSHVKIGEWSNWLKSPIKKKDDEHIDVLYKIKLLKVDGEGEKIRLQYSSIFTIDDWVKPRKYAEGLIKNALGGEVSYSSEVEYMIEGEIEDFLVEAQSECDGIKKSLHYMKKEIDWDLAMFHIHFLDSVNHYTLGYLYEDSPLRKEDPDYIPAAEKNSETAYRIIDEMLGYIKEKVIDENTVVFLVSDHGAIPVWKTVNLTRVFKESGLTSYKKGKSGYKVDWENTKAFPYFEPHYVWVNLEGRDPDGIVKEENYEKVRDEIISVLRKLKDPETGEKIMSLVMKKEDAAFLGQNGRRVGDVVYFLNPPYQLFDGDPQELNASTVSEYSMEKEVVSRSKVCYGAHAYYLPTVKFGGCRVSVPLLVNGPGIKKDIELHPPINIYDVAPTIAKILGIERPRESQGRILHEIFE